VVSARKKVKRSCFVVISRVVCDFLRAAFGGDRLFRVLRPTVTVLRQTTDKGTYPTDAK
jgi:hypothetical protein